MTQVKFTKGPWALNLSTISDTPVGWEIVATPSGSCNPIIVGMLKCGIDETISQNIFDARLIAAAPELYEALEAFTNNSSAQINYPYECEVAEKALAKARGESK